MFKSEKITFQEQTLFVTDIKPKKAKKGKLPILFVPGWTANADMFKDLIKAFVKNGRRVIVVNNFFGINHSHKLKYPNIILRNAEAIIATLKVKNLKKVDAIGHSSGCLHLSIATELHPNYFKKVVLATPAGLQGKDNLFKLMFRFSTDQIVQLRRSQNTPKTKAAIKQTMRTSRQAFKESLIYPVKEAQAIAKVQIKTAIQKARKNGVKIGVLHTQNDRAFPVEKISKSISKNLVDLYEIVEGTHNELYLSQEEQARIIENMLIKLAKQAAPRKS